MVDTITARDEYDLGGSLRAIVWMYYDMVQSYSMVGHNVDYEDVDSRRFLRVESENPNDPHLVRLASFLRDGATMALCCELYNVLSDEQRKSELLGFLRKVETDTSVRPETSILVSAATDALAEPIEPSWERLPAGRVLWTEMVAAFGRIVLPFFSHLAKESVPSEGVL